MPPSAVWIIEMPSPRVTERPAEAADLGLRSFSLIARPAASSPARLIRRPGRQPLHRLLQTAGHLAHVVLRARGRSVRPNRQHLNLLLFPCFGRAPRPSSPSSSARSLRTDRVFFVVSPLTHARWRRIPGDRWRGWSGEGRIRLHPRHQGRVGETAGALLDQALGHLLHETVVVLDGPRELVEHLDRRAIQRLLRGQRVGGRPPLSAGCENSRKRSTATRTSSRWVWVSSRGDWTYQLAHPVVLGVVLEVSRCATPPPPARPAPPRVDRPQIGQGRALHGSVAGQGRLDQAPEDGAATVIRSVISWLTRFAVTASAAGRVAARGSTW